MPTVASTPFPGTGMTLHDLYHVDDIPIPMRLHHFLHTSIPVDERGLGFFSPCALSIPVGGGSSIHGSRERQIGVGSYWNKIPLRSIPTKATGWWRAVREVTGRGGGTGPSATGAKLQRRKLGNTSFLFKKTGKEKQTVRKRGLQEFEGGVSACVGRASFGRLFGIRRGAVPYFASLILISSLRSILNFCSCRSRCATDRPVRFLRH